MRILVVEDEKKIASFIKRGLKEQKYSVDVICDGEEGLFMAEVNDYDLIVLDLMLPGKDRAYVVPGTARQGDGCPGPDADSQRRRE